MHAQKTGALFSASLLIPMDLGNIDETSPQGQAISRFAAELGLAFQAVDDFEDAHKKPDPTSVLYYLSLDEAKHLSQQSLKKAMADLEHQWGQKAAPLNQIADEVLKQL